jgi:predicted lipoprotein with Yx(FWY)xxD motif
MAAGIAIATLILVACSSGTSTTSNSAPVGGSTASGGATTVMVKNGPLGAYLTDASGKTLYVFAADTGTKSTCNGQCAAIWPPLITSGAPKAGSGATQSMLGTTTRDDGKTQVIYNGHPLYYYQGDSQPGQTNGQGLNLNGGLWWVVSPSGTAITGGAAPYPTSS